MPGFGRVRPALAAASLAASVLLSPGLHAQDTRGLGVRADSGDAVQLGSSHALLIAVEDYADPAVPRLDQPIRDAESLRDVLARRYRFEARDIDVLRDPTRDEILEKLFDLSERLGPDDNLLIFFAGHGHWDEQSQQGYWLPADARRANNARWISNGSIVDALRRIRTRHTLLVSDACFAGGIFVTRDASAGETAGLARLYQRPSRKAMTSGAREIVPDRSRFLEYLVRRLEENDAALLPAADLFTSLRAAVMNNSPVTPQYGTIYDAGDEGGDFLFALRDSAIVLPAVEPLRDPAARDEAAARTEPDRVTQPGRPATPPTTNVDSARRALAERNIAWSAASLAAAFAAADVEVLRLFSLGGAEPGMVLEALASTAGGGRTTALAFFERARGSAAALDWLRDAIARGLDPNATVPGPYYPREGLLIAAVRAGNAPAVLALLDGGASPHAYQELFLTPYPLDRFVMAFDAIVRNDTFTDVEKRAIVERFLAAGGIVPGLDGIEPNATNQTLAVQRLLTESESLAGVKLTPSPSLADRPRTRVCEVATARDAFDWCALVAALPRRVLAGGSSRYVDFFTLELVGLMNVVDGKAYLMGVEREAYHPGFDVVEVSRDARIWRVYRFMNPAAGMGLCTEDDNGDRRDDCWRRISMRYDADRGIMRVEDYYDYRVER